MNKVNYRYIWRKHWPILNYFYFTSSSNDLSSFPKKSKNKNLNPWMYTHICIYMSIYVEHIRSDQISLSVVSDSLRPHESQHTRPPCPSPTPGVHWDSRPSRQWWHPAISSSVFPFFSCPQSLLASDSFPLSQPFALSGQSTAVSALASFLPKKSQGWSPSEWTGWISLQSKGL